MRGSRLVIAALLLLLPPPIVAAQAGATVTVEPPEGPYGTAFQPRATGLPPGAAVYAIIRLPTGEERSTPLPEAVGPDGEWLPPPWVSEPGEPVGRYGVFIVRVGAATRLASGAFTVTGEAPDELTPARPPVQLPGTHI
jgi:hypothetical protein